MPIKKKIPPLEKFDWESLPLELFRGPGGSFPTEMELHIGPGYNLTVYRAAKSFIEEFTGHYSLDREADSFPLVISETLLNAKNEPVPLTEHSFAIVAQYICSSTKLIMFNLSYEKVLH